MVWASREAFHSQNLSVDGPGWVGRVHSLLELSAVAVARVRLAPAEARVPVVHK